MVPRIGTLTLDCADARRLAEFWSAALGYRIEEIDEDGGFIRDPGGQGVAVFFQVVPEPKTVKNRLHMDLRPPDSMAEEVARVKALGATELRFVEQGGSFWTVMQDPEGNEFCVLRGPKDGWSPDG